MAVRVPLQFVKPPMRLARPVLDGEGRLVAGAGTVLGESVVRTLRNLALQSVLVEGGTDLPSWETVEPLEVELRDLADRFGAEPDAGPRAELRAAIGRYLERRAARLATETETS